MYEFSSRIRYSESGPDGHLALTSLVSYFQDCSFFHSLEVGHGPDYWRAHHFAWMVVSWRILISEYPKYGERVRVATIPYRFHAFEADRNFLMRGEDGRTLAAADSRWVYFDTEKKLPVRVPEEEMAVYPLDPKLDLPAYPRHIRKPDVEPVRKRPFRIRQTSIDMNQHVNNEQYIVFASGYLPQNAGVKELHVDYQAQAMLGDTLAPLVYRNGDEETVVLQKEGSPCATVRFVVQ